MGDGPNKEPEEETGGVSTQSPMLRGLMDHIRALEEIDKRIRNIGERIDL